MLGLPLPPRLFDDIAATTPFIANVKPSGKFLMEEFSYAGGVPAVLKELSPLLHLDAITANGKTVGENLQKARGVLQSRRHSTLGAVNRCWPRGGVVVLTGNSGAAGGRDQAVRSVSPQLDEASGTRRGV